MAQVDLSKSIPPLSALNEALDTLNNLQTEIDRAKRAQIDMTTQQANKDAAMSKLLAIKAAYYPGQ